MQRWRGQEEIPTDWGRCVLTIGVFDGVHRGHQELINHAVKAGRSRGVPTVLMTFDPHPMEVVFPGSHPAQLTTLTRRAELVEELGIDVFLVMPFTADFMKLTPERYVHELLVERLHGGVHLLLQLGHFLAVALHFAGERGLRCRVPRRALQHVAEGDEADAHGGRGGRLRGRGRGCRERECGEDCSCHVLLRWNCD